MDQKNDDNFKFSLNTSLEDLRIKQEDFANDRDWNKYHTPRNLLLALTGEIGELAELFQWKNEVSYGLKEFSEHEKVRVGEEISDCLLYLIRLSDRCQIDLPQAVLRKIQQNSQKYPSSQCKGSSKKYNEYETVQNTEILQEQMEKKQD